MQTYRCSLKGGRRMHLRVMQLHVAIMCVNAAHTNWKSKPSEPTATQLKKSHEDIFQRQRDLF